MTPSKLLLITAAMALSAAAANAQGVARMTLKPESKLTLAGSSNIHEWACASSQFQAEVDVDSSYLTLPATQVAKPISRVRVTIPVRSLKCGHGKMDSNMYKALNADQFPNITYALGQYTLDATATTADTFVAKTLGALTVAGKTITVSIPITATRAANGSVTGTGSVKLLMTDLGIDPPTALLGTLRTKNEIEIAFTVLLDKSVIVALMQQ
jgi:polyisoprenoid-binding protein YceI